MIKPSEIKKIYDKGLNVSAYLRSELNIDFNSSEIIELSYDLQAGSYTEKVSEDESAKNYYRNYSKKLVDTILKECRPNSILEAGVGEATTLAHVLDNFDYPIESYGFDISYSRIIFANKYLEGKGHHNTRLCTGNLLNIPFLDNSIDVVYTSHSMEPNGGREIEILKELYRVTNKYLILLEPAYELSSKEDRKRMDFHGYCKGLKSKSIELGFNVIEHKIFSTFVNSHNKTAITIIKKNDAESLLSDKFACPKFKSSLKNVNDALFSEEALTLYPIINKIPCLMVENGILATKMLD
jgi:ubiquinone/menaquinone biosynthesis C-methylase UbiE